MLEKIFTSKTRIKVMGFLFFNEEDTYLREISKRLKIPVSAVKREVDNLFNAGIIEKKKNKIILNKNCNIIEDLKNIFIKTEFIVYPIRKSLEKINAKFILIFGSFAKGDYSFDSDIDLLIIGNGKQSEAFKLLKNVENKIEREINPIIWTLEELKKNKNKGFVRDIRKKNKIMIKGDKNEFQRIIG